ncbi:MAG: hypothetical protein EA400_03830 [Chromatiaceae bacterium]|nr:MAG: hypothetical protein EA400_03830 [Chromatiaceae bacterium]
MPAATTAADRCHRLAPVRLMSTPAVTHWNVLWTQHRWELAPSLRLSINNRNLRQTRAAIAAAAAPRPQYPATQCTA